LLFGVPTYVTRNGLIGAYSIKANEAKGTPNP